MFASVLEKLEQEGKVVLRQDFMELQKAAFAALQPVWVKHEVQFGHSGPDVLRAFVNMMVDQMDHDLQFNIPEAIDEAVVEFYQENRPVGTPRIPDAFFEPGKSPRETANGR